VRIIHSYILRLHLVPFLLGFGVVTFILMMDLIFDYLDLLVTRGVGAWVVLQLFLLSLGWMIALSVPCAVLVATLMTFGRLSQDNEVTALRSSGVNMASVLVGPLAAAGVLTVALMGFNSAVLPETNHSFLNLLIDIGRMRPTVKLQEGAFINDFPGFSILVQSINPRTNELRGVTLYQQNAAGRPTTILAKRGRLAYTPDGHTAVLELFDGEIHEIPAEEGEIRRYRRLLFNRHVIYLQGAGGILERSVRQSRTDREMSTATLLGELRAVREQYASSLGSKRERLARLGADSSVTRWLDPQRYSFAERAQLAVGGWLHRDDPLEAASARSPEWRSEIALWRAEQDALRRRMAGLAVEVHKKFSLPAACVVFVLVGAPLGMRVRRAGPAVAFLSIGFFVFYYMCLVGGEELANRLLIPPGFAMWLPNLVLGAWGLDLTLRACEVRPPWDLRRSRA
jgi:lipopolysaccharide export system permease protein